MPDNSTQRPSDWYTLSGFPTATQESAWYGATSGPALFPADPDRSASGEPADGLSDKQSKRRRRTKTVSLSVCAVALLLAVVMAVGQSLRIYASARPSAPTAEQPGFSIPDMGQPETYDDFREYFENYYQTSSDIDMPAASTGTGVTLPLQPLRSQELSFQEIYAKVSPAVVGITAYLDGMEYSWGTGIVFTADGYVITNTHILQGCTGANVVFPDGGEYEARLVGADEASDIAVLYIDGENLPYAEFGQSDSLRVGDEAIAIGNPLGEAYAGTMTNGIISAINRNIVYNGHSMTLLQTNAALNEGNSGGPLISAGGQVIGITNMKIMSSYTSTVEGIGFAIPSAVVKQIADQLIENGIVLGEPTIGIVAGSVSQEAMELYGLPDGVYVSQVNEGSDALEKGLQVGDVIIAVNGQWVNTVAQVNLIKEGLEVGDTITLTVYRDGETFDLEVALVDRRVIG